MASESEAGSAAGGAAAAEEAAASAADAALSPYEQGRAKKMLRNAAKLASLGIASAGECAMLLRGR